MIPRIEALTVCAQRAADAESQCSAEACGDLPADLARELESSLLLLHAELHALPKTDLPGGRCSQFLELTRLQVDARRVCRVHARLRHLQPVVDALG